MNTAELRALADSAVRLEGPCRETDVRIALATGSGCVERFVKSQNGDWLRDGSSNAPAYTASLDAAMTLGRDFLLVAMSDIAADGLPAVCLCSDTSTTPPREHWGIVLGGATGPREQVLARCYTAAALRARAAMMETNDE